MQPTLIAVAIIGALVGGYFLIASPLGPGGSMIYDTSDIEVNGTCEDPAARQFDFWVGEWNLTWGDDGQGHNVIRPIMGGCVIEENFSAPSGGYFGKSVSAYAVQQGIWKQTWVDNNGSYLDFTGGMEGNQMILRRQFTNAEGQAVMQRMRFYDIEKDHFDWSWERSLDEGQTWEPVWQIHYERRK